MSKKKVAPARPTASSKKSTPKKPATAAKKPAKARLRFPDRALNASEVRAISPKPTAAVSRAEGERDPVKFRDALGVMAAADAVMNPMPPPASGPDASAAASRVETPQAQPDAALRPAATPEEQLLANAFDALAAAEADEDRCAAVVKAARESLAKAGEEAEAARGAFGAAVDEVARARFELARKLRLLRPGQMVERGGRRYLGHRQLRVFDLDGKPIMQRNPLSDLLPL